MSAIADAARPRYSGIYAVSDASLFLRATTNLDSLPSLTSRHLHWWIREGLAQRYLVGTRSRGYLITFLDLISLRMVAIFRAHGVTARDIKTAHVELKRRYDWEYPFAMADFWTMNPRDILMRVDEQFVSVSRGWQVAFQFIEEYVKPAHGLSFDLDNVAASWTPKQEVLLDPRVQFGEPCVAGTRISTEVIWAFHRAGNSVDDLANLYDIAESQVKAAIDWESVLDAAR